MESLKDGCNMSILSRICDDPWKGINARDNFKILLYSYNFTNIIKYCQYLILYLEKYIDGLSFS